MLKSVQKNINVKGELVNSNIIKNSILSLKEAIKNDPDYAWSWHCNLAMCAYDEGLDMAAANRSAMRFMKILFDYDMTKHELYKNTQN